MASTSTTRVLVVKIQEAAGAPVDGVVSSHRLSPLGLPVTTVIEPKTPKAVP